MYFKSRESAVQQLVLVSKSDERKIPQKKKSFSLTLCLLTTSSVGSALACLCENDKIILEASLQITLKFLNSNIFPT